MDGSKKIKNLVFLFVVFIVFQACNSSQKASLHLYENNDDNIDISNILRNIDSNLVYESVEPERFQNLEQQYNIKYNYEIDSIESFQKVLESKYADSLLYFYNIEEISSKTLNLDSNFTSQEIIKPERDTVFIEKEIFTERVDTVFVEREVSQQTKTVNNPDSITDDNKKDELIFIPPVDIHKDKDTSTVEKSTFIHSEDLSSKEEIFLPSENLFIPVILPFKTDSSAETKTEKVDFINTKDSSSIFQIYAQYGVYLNKLLKDEAIYTDEEKAIIKNLKEQVTIYDASDSTIHLNFDLISFQSLPINLKIDSLNHLKNSIVLSADSLEADTLIMTRKDLVEKIKKKKVEAIIREKISNRESTEKQLQSKWTDVFPLIKTSRDSTLIVLRYSPNKTLPDSFEELAKAIEEMLAYYDSKNATVLLSSHTDAQGSAAYNLQLSEQRAKNLKAALVKKGVAENKIFYQFFGAKYATLPPKPEERRVEVLILR